MAMVNSFLYVYQRVPQKVTMALKNTKSIEVPGYNCYLDELEHPHDLGNLPMMSCGCEDRILQIRSEWGHHHLLWMFHTRNGEIQKHLKEGQKPEQMN